MWSSLKLNLSFNLTHYGIVTTLIIINDSDQVIKIDIKDVHWGVYNVGQYKVGQNQPA